MIYPVNATSQSIDFFLADDTGLPVTGKVAATLPAITGSLAGANADVAIALSDLASITSAWSSGGVKERGNGYYRLDVPNSFYTAAGCVTIRGEVAGMHVITDRLLIGVNVSLSLSGTVSYAGPVNPLTGAVQIYRGADYLTADGRQLDFTNADGNWPDLTGGTVVFEYKDGDGKVLSYTMSIITPSGVNQKVRLQLTNAQTGALLGKNYSFTIVATLADASIVPLTQGGMTVLPQI